MAVIGIAIIFSLAMSGLALWANARFRSEDRLPMQWLLTGEVTWSAPRPWALAFIPALAVGVFVPLCAVLLNVRPRAGQEGLLLPSFIAVGVIVLGVQIFHLWMVERTLRRSD